MLRMYIRLQALRARHDRGATAVEYGLLVAVIAMVVVATAIVLGDNIAAMFDDASTCVATPTAANCP